MFQIRKARNGLVVGLDYGTTYTGVSFCERANTTSHDIDPEIIQNWPVAHTKVATKDKVPSEIAFDNGKVLWGSSIPSHRHRHMWTKLLLDDNHEGQMTKIESELSKSTKEPPRSSVQISAAFLGKVKEHLFYTLTERFGEDLLKTLPITLVVTVPAVWSDRAKARTMEAVSKAGFNTSELPQLEATVIATEPECAAIYAITEMRKTVHDNGLKVGDAFIVCDMGGGTVDLVSYKVVSLNPLKVQEATVGTGDQCGGSFVDRAFLVQLELWLGTDDFLKIAGCRSSALPYTVLDPAADKMLRDFCLDAKGCFSGDETNYIQLPFPLNRLADDESRNIERGELRIDPDDMVKMFEWPIRRTYELLGQQLDQLRKNKGNSIKYVFLVGGFAESHYVYNKIKKFAETSFGVRVRRPKHPWSAIARGAAAKGMEGTNASITLRKCRRHYAQGVCSPFKPGEHDESDSFIHPYSGTKYAKHQIRYFLNKGQDLPTTGPAHATIELHHDFWTGEERVVMLKLLACNEDAAPQRSDDSNIFNVAELTVDLSDVPNHNFRPRRNPITGKKYLQLDCTVEIMIQSAIEYSVVVDDVRYGSVTAEYK